MDNPKTINKERRRVMAKPWICDICHDVVPKKQITKIKLLSGKYDLCPKCCKEMSIEIFVNGRCAESAIKKVFEKRWFAARKKGKENT